MPLVDHAHLNIGKPTKADIMVECFPEPGKFSNPVDEPESDDDTEEMTILFPVLALRVGKGVEELLVDPVCHGWRRAIRIVGYLQSCARIHQHRAHREIQWDCKICILGSILWDPVIEEQRAQDYFFRWETNRIKGNVKPEVLSRYDEQQGIIYDSGRLGMEFQFKTQDLDQVKMDFVDKHDIIKPVPVVWWDSPVLYLYLMLIHTKSNMHAALEPTVKEIHKMMRVPKGLRALIKKVIADCIRCRILAKKTVELKSCTGFKANHPEACTTLAPFIPV